MLKYERLLISLRLPCVYVWRAQGGYGQFTCCGVPVSFSNPVAALALSLPHRASSVVFSVILENGRQINLKAFNVRRALVRLKLNNPLYTNIEIHDDLNDIGLTQTSRYPVPLRYRMMIHPELCLMNKLSVLKDQ